MKASLLDTTEHPGRLRPLSLIRDIPMYQPPCPRCGQKAWTRRSRRRLWERLLSFAAIYPFRCHYCLHRFRVRQRGVRYVRN